MDILLGGSVDDVVVAGNSVALVDQNCDASSDPFSIIIEQKTRLTRDSREARFRALIRAAQNGEDAAYLALLEELTPFLKRIVRARMPFLQQADVEDLVQDVLLSLHAARATYDPKLPFLPWIIVITHNRMADHARRYERRMQNEVLVDEIPEIYVEHGPNKSGSAIGDADALRREISNLPRGQRKAVELLKLRELSLKEAATVSGMSISSLKASVHRAMKSLRSSKYLRTTMIAENAESLEIVQSTCE